MEVASYTVRGRHAVLDILPNILIGCTRGLPHGKSQVFICLLTMRRGPKIMRRTFTHPSPPASALSPRHLSRRSRHLGCCLLALLWLGPAACLEPEEGDDAVIIIDAVDDIGKVDMGERLDMAEGGDDGGDTEADMTPDGPTLGCEGEAFHGEIYTDTNLSATSRYNHRRDDEDAPLEGEPIVLIGKDVQLESQTCAGGTFGADKLPDGRYLFGLKALAGRTNASSSQAPRLLEVAQAKETVDVVVFGDSIPAWGPHPRYPAQLEEALDEVIDASVENIAKPGTRSVDWLPGSSHYQNILTPRLLGADLFVFSLGGNDLYEFANGGVDPNDPGAAIEEFDRVVDEVIANIKLLITSIRQVNPDADIVWMLYPNYATSERWAALAPDLITVIESLLASKLSYIRKQLAHHEGVIIWDTFSATRKLDLDDYLIDELHLNAAGHALWSKELFLTLGGVIIEEGVSIEAAPREIGIGK